MTLLLYVALVLSLCIFVSWWFLAALIVPALKLPMLLKRARVLKVLASDYDYQFPARSPQASTLNRMERETRSRKLSDTDLATLFMAVMVDSLGSDSNDDAKAFARRVQNTALRLRWQGLVSDSTYACLEDAVTKACTRSAAR
jgi:hypothetical protein